MFIIEHTIEIKAPAAKVWQVIVEMENYEQWNSQLFYLGGNLALGEKIQLKLITTGQKGYEFKPKIIVFKEGKEFTWLAQTGFKGIFDGEHHFTLKERNDTTILHNYEKYSGLLSPLMQRLPMMKDADKGFALMNQEIKLRAESKK